MNVRFGHAGNVAFRMPPRGSLRSRLLLHLWGPLLALLVVGGAGAYGVAQYVETRVHDQWLLDSAQTLASQVRVRDGKVTLDLPAAAIEMFEWDRVDRIFEEVTDGHGRRLLKNADFPPPPHALRRGKAHFRDGTLEGRAVRIVAIEMDEFAPPEGPVRIQVAETLQKRSHDARIVMRGVIPLQALIVVCAGVIVWLVVTRNLRGLASIAQQLEGYRADDLAPVASSESAPTEVKPLIDATNQLIARLQENRDAQRRFVANAAHQLRTPLAALEIQAERALREPDAARQREALADVHRAVSRLHHIAHQLLTLMRSDRMNDVTIPLVDVDLVRISREALESWADAAVAREVDLGYEGPQGPVMVSAEPHLLRELLDNLLDNAIRYGRKGGSVTLTVSETPVALFVDDDGPGIPAAEREMVFERFYRGVAAESEGCGLGLAIAREIALRHSAALTLEDAPGGKGLRVHLAFPSHPPR